MTKPINNEKIVTESDEARQNFINTGLTYKDITYSDFLLLYWALQMSFERHNKKQEQAEWEKRSYFMTVAEKPQYIKAKTGMKKGFIKVICDNYSTREAISFNEDGFIGFAGWASSDNVKPIIKAFNYWLGAIERYKNMYAGSATHKWLVEELKEKPELLEVIRNNTWLSNSYLRSLDAHLKKELNKGGK